MDKAYANFKQSFKKKFVQQNYVFRNLEMVTVKSIVNMLNFYGIQHEH